MKKSFVAGLLLACGLARAALEGAPSELPASHVQRTAQTTSAGVPYTDVHRTLKSGTVVDEYVDASGTVFAVAWSGPFKPDLKQLLGRHFGRLAQHSGGGHANRSRVDVDTGDLVVQSSGHMGAFVGHAWVPARLPAGFDPQEMK